MKNINTVCSLSMLSVTNLPNFSEFSQGDDFSDCFNQISYLYLVAISLYDLKKLWLAADKILMESSFSFEMCLFCPLNCSLNRN